MAKMLAMLLIKVRSNFQPQQTSDSQPEASRSPHSRQEILKKMPHLLPTTQKLYKVLQNPNMG
jgi:hypothetical protein